jgi:hypothetical protein
MTGSGDISIIKEGLLSQRAGTVDSFINKGNELMGHIPARWSIAVLWYKCPAVPGEDLCLKVGPSHGLQDFLT